MLRDTFDGLADARQAHRDDHRSLHAAHNTVIYADDHAGLHEAVDAAATHKRPRVLLTPGSTYTLTQTLTLPGGVMLEGGGMGYSSLRATIVADAPLDPMMQLSNYSHVVGCNINGKRLAVGAIFGQGTIGNIISDNLIWLCNEYGCKFGGALYITLKRNAFSNLNGGYALDALTAYKTDGSSAYYGLNVGLSEGNTYINTGIRIEGMLTSVQDDFEGAFDQVWVRVGGTVQSTLAMYAGYLEIKASTTPIRAFFVSGGCRVSLRDLQAFGATSDTEAVFLGMWAPFVLNVTGCNIQRFATAFDGYVAPSSNVAIHGNVYAHTQTVNSIDGLAGAQSVFCVWPGDRIGVPS